jgi:arylsulfatase A-like enzyme
MDLFPTALELAGHPAPPGIDGVSLLPTLMSPAAPPRPARDLFFTRREGGSRFGGKTIDAVIRGKWKLLQNSPYGPLELYDLETDPLERTDLSGREKKIFNDLSAALRRQIQRGGGVPWQ